MLPKTTSLIILSSEEGDFSDWASYAEKGIFAFDFQDIHRKTRKNQYDLIARPFIPLNLTELNLSSTLLSSIVKLNCVFANGDVKTSII